MNNSEFFSNADDFASESALWSDSLRTMGDYSYSPDFNATDDGAFADLPTQIDHTYQVSMQRV